LLSARKIGLSTEQRTLEARGHRKTGNHTSLCSEQFSGATTQTNNDGAVKLERGRGRKEKKLGTSLNPCEMVKRGRGIVEVLVSRKRKGWWGYEKGDRSASGKVRRGKDKTRADQGGGTKSLMLFERKFSQPSPASRSSAPRSWDRSTKDKGKLATKKKKNTTEKTWSEDL